ncbi:MAG: SDR family oxidoreductase [Bacteroidota bacterium]
MQNFSSKTALIIGGTSGIGWATAQFLLEEGAQVHIVGRNPAKVPDQIGLSRHQLDLTDKKELICFSEVINELEKLDYLVNASGIFGPKPFLEHTLEDYDNYLDLNRGFFVLSQQAAKKMKEQGGGAIVNVGSMWAKQAIKATPSSAYSMQKAGLHALTQHLAMELAEFNIRVNAVSPAVVKTPVYHGVFGSEKAADEALKSFHGFHPIGRFGRPE